MQRCEARRLAETCKEEELIGMLARARVEIVDWRKPSRINPSLSRGAVFNIFIACDLKTNGAAFLMAKTNMIAEFGEYLPGYQPTKRRARRKADGLLHSDPKPYPIKEAPCDLTTANKL